MCIRDRNGYRQEILLNVVFDNGQVNAVAEWQPSDVRVFPNPTEGLLNIRMKGLKAIVVRNAEGRVVREVHALQDAHRLDLDALPSGVYTLELHGAEGIDKRRVILR